MLDSIKKMARELEDPPSEYSGYVVTDFMFPDNILVFKSYKLTLTGTDFHARYVMAICLTPSATVVVDNQFFDVYPGEAILIFPHQYHHYMNVFSKNIIWLFITFTMEHTGCIGMLKNTTLKIPSTAWKQIRELMRFYTLDDKKTALGRNELAYRTALLLNELLKTRDSIVLKQKDEGGSHRELLRRIGELVWSTEQPRHITDIAKDLAVSESHLRRIFRNAVGVSLGKYIRQSHIYRTAEMIDHTDLTFSEIADRYGFDSLYAFSRSFKAEMGVSPSEYRNYLRDRKKNPIN
jgi:AraC-like DNA-binding protein